MSAVQSLFLLCFLTCALCSVLLICGWLRVRIRLLLCVSLGFAFLAIGNGILFFDVVVSSSPDLTTARLGANLIAVAILLYGVAKDARDG